MFLCKCGGFGRAKSAPRAFALLGSKTLRRLRSHLGAPKHCAGLLRSQLGVRKDCAGVLRSHLGARTHCAGVLRSHLGAHLKTLENARGNTRKLEEARGNMRKLEQPREARRHFRKTFENAFRGARLLRDSATLHSVSLHSENGYSQVHTSV